MEVKNMVLTKETDNIVSDYLAGKIPYREAINLLWPQALEISNRIYKVVAEYRLNEVDSAYVKIWLRKWNEEPEYTIYNADEVDLLIHENKLFLIPLASKKPIKLIIAE
jgi:hypothetical protein